MSRAIPILSEDEVRRWVPVDEADRCFGSLRTARGHLPLKAMRVDTRLVGLLAHTRVRQTFVNTSGEPLEATYIFPLPDRAGVSGFRFEVDGRVVEGELQERGQARQSYDNAVRTGHRAAIAEEERPGVFTMRVGNLMPGEVATVELTLDGPLPYSEGEATFRFPLVVAPRYMPGVPLGGGDVGDGVAADTTDVPDASRISPPVLLAGYPNPVHLELTVELDPIDLPLGDIRSSLHTVVEEHGSNRRSRRLRVLPGERLNRDFVLRFELGGADVRSTLALCPDRDRSGAGTFLLTLVPPSDSGQAKKPRDVVFVLDRSGSMQGWKMVAARRAVARMIDSLRPQDRFQVLAFDNSVEQPSFVDAGELAEATDRNRFRAVEFCSHVDARGGTEMVRPLRQAAGMLRGGYQDTERVLVLITDGQVGNEGQVVKMLDDELRGARIFTVGIDRAVNAGLLRRLASSTGGHCELVESESRLDDVLETLHRRIDAPVLSELILEERGLRVDRASFAPGRLPDLFAGSPVQVTGRYTGAPEGEIRIRARDSRGKRAKHTAVGVFVDNPAVEKVWARARLRDMEDAFDRGERGLERDIVDVSLRHGVMCRFTSFVAVDRAEVVNPGGWTHNVTQGVEAPSGWGMLGQSESMDLDAGVRTRSGVLKGKGMRRMSRARPAPSGGLPPPPSRVQAKEESAAMRSAPMDRASYDEEEMDDLFAGEAAPELSADFDEGTDDNMMLSEAAAMPEPAARSAGAPPPPPPSQAQGFADKSAKVDSGWEREETRAPAKKRKASFLERGRDALRSIAGISDERGGGLAVVTAHQRVQAARLLEDLEQEGRAGWSARHHAMRMHAPLARDLLDELLVAGVNNREVVRLDEALRVVFSLLSQKGRHLRLDEGRIAQAWVLLTDALRDLAGSAAPMTAVGTPRRESFWR
jgi:Ca-activated chloride channel family protein